jgi:nitronate monooxygenase
MTQFSLEDLDVPIVQAPMGGGPSTVALAVAVARAGALPFLAAGYKQPDAVREDIAALRAATDRPFGVNLFAPPDREAEPGAVAAYAASLAAEGTPGDPRHDDDAWQEKLALARVERVPVISFTFGCPPAEVVASLREAGSAVWVTVTTPEEAVVAARVGADALVVQGAEAGGHRGSFASDAPGDIGLIALLQLVGAAVELPMVAAGGIADGRGVAAALAAGAGAAALGSALMRTDEAGTSAPHRAALAAGRPTDITRAFTGRPARGIVNRFMREHEADAPVGYPDVHHVTAPLRAAARERGDAEVINLWAGQAHPLAREGGATDLIREIAADARRALAEAARRHSSGPHT